MTHLILAVTGASGTLIAEQLVEKSPWPVDLIMSKWGKEVYKRECGRVGDLEKKVHAVYDNDDLSEAVSSGSVLTQGMVIAPCSCNTLGEIASGVSNTLISRAAHCHLKEQRRLVLCLRESPLSLIDMENSVRIAKAGGIIMPMSPPFYMVSNTNPQKISWYDVMALFTDRVLSLFGNKLHTTWEDLR